MWSDVWAAKVGFREVGAHKNRWVSKGLQLQVVSRVPFGQIVALHNIAAASVDKRASRLAGKMRRRWSRRAEQGRRGCVFSMRSAHRQRD